jgi:alkylhydroperoxidase/carboxymuconolactone decarboxylase family protein YurZ
MSDTPDRIQHFIDTLGNVPPAISAMEEAAPDALEGYVQMRRWIMRDGALPLKFKELIFVVLDVIAHNLAGAKNHLAAAMRAGLTTEELAEALIQVMMVHGIQTWGICGYQVMEYARALHASPELLKAKPSPK